MDLNLDNLFPRAEPELKAKYARSTLFQSPIVTNFYNDFKILLLKPQVGLSSKYVNDEGDQTLSNEFHDSIFENISEDDDLIFVEPKAIKPVTPKSRTVRVLVKYTSINVDGVDFPLTSAVRASCRIPDHHDDSLILSLRSGAILLVRFWFVPRSKEVTGESLASHVFRPFVVQWWKSEGQKSLESPGAQLLIHQSGLVAAFTSSAGVFRVHVIQNTDAGVQLLPHENIPVPGVILHSCFARLESNYFRFLIVSVSEQKLIATLYGWFLDDSISQNLDSCTLPLAQMPVPSLIIPLFDSFLFACPNLLTVITVHHITSADFSFKRFEFEELPTAYYIGDVTYIGTDSGRIFEVTIEKNEVTHVRQRFRVSGSISKFTVTKLESGYELTYCGDSTSYHKLLISEDEANDLQLEQSVGRLLDMHLNWAPIVDVEIIDAYKSRYTEQTKSQELWALTGLGKKTKLLSFHFGYPVRQTCATYEQLRNTVRLQHFTYKEEHFVVCSMSFNTELLQCRQDDGDLVKIVLPPLKTDDHTLHCLVSSFVYQFTSTSIISSDLMEYKEVATDGTILFVDSAGPMGAMILESDSLQLSLFSATTDIHKIDSIPLDFEPSMLRVIEREGKVTILIGSFAQEVHVMDFEDRFSKKTISIDGIPHDCAISDRGLHVGTKEGKLVLIRENLDSTITQLGNSPVLLVCQGSYVVAQLRSLYLVNFHVSDVPVDILFEQKIERSITSVALLPFNGPFLRLVVARDDGVTVGTVSLFQQPVLKQVPLYDRAKQVAYFDALQIFVVIVKSRTNPIKFVDRKLYKLLGVDLKGMFQEKEFPVSCLVWNIERKDRLSKKLVVATIEGNRGSIKIIDLYKTIVDEKRVINAVELLSISHSSRISCLALIGPTIFFASGDKIFSTTYDVERKKLKQARQMMILSSDVTSMSALNGSLNVNTRMDSILSFNFENDTLTVAYKDNNPRSITNHAHVSSRFVVADKLFSTLYLLDPVSKSSEHLCKLGFIPRVYKANFASSWETNELVLAVGVNGEMLLLRQEKELGDGALLMRPFSGKVTGKGLFALYKPFFDYAENDLIDCNVAEYSHMKPKVTL